jgi:hypothetical protein
MLDLPVGCLFGGGGDTVGKDVSLSKLTTLMFGYDGKAGTGYSYWPMPFRSRARVEVVNESGTDLESFGLGVERGGPDPAYPAGDAGYLAVTRTLDASPLGAHYSRAFRQRGYGKVVGLMMYSSGFNMDGDEFTYFDGSKTPQIHGDGTEDDHNQGWGGYAIQKPLWGGLINGFDGAYRLYLAEPYVFQNEVRITYEHSNWGGAREGEKTDFVVWSYLGTPGMGNLVETDMVDIGDAAGEQAHQFKVEGQTWAGRTKASYDKYEQGDPFPTEDDGIAFTNRIEFTVRIDPGNDGVRLRRRLNRHTANVQLARVFVDGQEIADTPWYFCDLPTPAQTAFADNDFEIPARYTRGKKRVAVRIEHVRAEPANANNAYRFTAFCYGRKPLPPPPPDPASEPLEVQATATPRGSVAISWKPGMESPADDFTVQRRSGDGGDFKTLVQTRSNETAFVDQDTRFFGQYRYRIRGETAGGPSVWRESNPVLVLPAASNRLDGAIASASSMWDATYSPAKACDGDLTTRWNSAQGAFADQWLAFDLKKPERLNTVVVYQETTWTRIAKHEVQARIGGEWKTVFEGDAMPDIEVCRFAPVETDGIRIRMTKTTGNSPTIKEVQAFLAKAIEEKP